MVEHKPKVSVDIRPYEPDDLERLRWLFARNPPWGRTYPRPQALPDDLEDVAGNYGDGAWVALEQDMAGEALVGFAAVAPLNAAEARELPAFVDGSRRISRVHWITVAPERWRLGLGRRLTQTTIDWSREQRFEATVLETSEPQEGAIALYEAMGFVETGRYVLNGRWRQVWLELGL